VWWKEAAGAFSDRPIGGWGAGSFSVVHLLYRRDTLSVQQPHSVPLQFLAETGVIGASLALGAGALLLAGGVGAVRRRTSERERLLAAALLAGGVAYAVHELYDWDWNIPGVTIPALVFLGVLGGSLRPGQRGRRLGGLARPRRVGLRVLALATATLGMLAFALSVVVPQVAASEASQAIVTASTASGARLRQALSTALSASRLDPLSDAGLKAASTIAIHLGRRTQARRYLLAAVDRNPTDGQAWQELAFEDFATGDDREGLAAVQRARALDPQGRFAIGLAQAAMLTLAPPADSATAGSTPPASVLAVSPGGGISGR
jgi:tetratricopeptide (TPR) repeat protein